ncbi:MAG: chorismate synthase [Eubacteriaceae bacterium]|jgi:chorismate synthase|nr:chorismate synthase [Eubacteriaceae bacterium]
MGSTWGNHIQITLFGESHGPGIGVVLDKLPPGISLDMDLIEKEMYRRSAVNNPYATPRKEKDVVEILSGVFNGATTGTPLAAIIKNENTRSKDYAQLLVQPRPGHADLTGAARYSGFQDHRGGGHFSGRITAPLVFAGAVAKMYLKSQGFEHLPVARILAIGGIEDPCEPTVSELENLSFRDERFPVLHSATEEKMKGAILRAAEDEDSLGGVVQVVTASPPPGLGDPFFDSVESRIAHLVFSVPAVKGLSFGAGFKLSAMRGSQANDPYRIQNGKIVTETNHNGGLLGGISSGMPVVFQVAIKPTASIGKAQKTLNLSSKQVETLKIKGRHDPCIVPRVCVVLEAVTAIAWMECWMEALKNGCIESAD